MMVAAKNLISELFGMEHETAVMHVITGDPCLGDVGHTLSLFEPHASLTLGRQNRIITRTACAFDGDLCTKVGHATETTKLQVRLKRNRRHV